ncbi:Acetyltransferase [Gaiella occulta]|uniref:Acetyltransferase n=1 Tax=Gaiella occulta TaxID=1002870 RepID=A0A7M2YUP0_9ACTN|nr:GNAT family protein [Gaiella occulta]RDI73460.1 Acetyltransferase [Gaiella occulta]
METWRAATLTGRVVRLEPLRRDHLGDLVAASRDERVWAWLPVARPDAAGMRAWLEDALARAAAGLDIPFATVSQMTGRAIGSTRYLALRPEHRSVEIGWTWLAPEAWGTGANVEAKLLQLGNAFEGWGCRRVEFKTDARNERSRGALEALGARFEGVHAKHMLVRGGESRDSAWYAILDDDWPSLRARLQARLAPSTASTSGR